MPGKEYRFQVAEQRNFVIVFPSMVSAFLKDAREAGIAGGKLKLEQILEKPKAEYLLRMINSNRAVFWKSSLEICKWMERIASTALLLEMQRE